ncbi:hypothetical protein V8D89_013055 [Ganoderma adspersum]
MARFTEAVQATAEYWAWSIRMNNYFSVVGYAILFYDYTLTFSTEVECFWKSTHISLFSILFVLNRYFGLLGAIPTIFEYFGSPSENVMMITTKNPNETKIPMPFTLSKCDLSLTNAQGLHIAIAWAAMLWFDTTIFVLTLARAWRMHRRVPGGVLETLFRDGTIYYGIMVVSAVANIITFLVTPSGSNLKGMETTLTNALSTTLASRLILNLRDRTAHHIGEGRTTHIHAWTSTAAQSVISRVVFGRDQIKPLETFELASSTETDSVTKAGSPGPVTVWTSTRVM